MTGDCSVKSVAFLKFGDLGMVKDQNLPCHCIEDATALAGAAGTTGHLLGTCWAWEINVMIHYNS